MAAHFTKVTGDAFPTVIAVRQTVADARSFPLASFPVMRWGEKGGRMVAIAGHGERNGREVLFFNYVLNQKVGYKNIQSVIWQTFIAARGGTECFPAAKSDPTLHLETAEGWTIAYWRKKLLSAEEIRSLVVSIPGRQHQGA
jgi:hypothetical protein